MDRTSDQFVPQQGMTVYGADGDKIGDIDAVEQDYVVVRKGFFFPQDHFIPMDAIASYDDNGIYLSYTKEQVLEQQWAEPPTTGTTLAGTQADARAADLNQVDTSTRAGQDTVYDDLDVERTTDEGMERDAEPFTHEQDTQRTHVNEDDDLRVDVHEEELVARRREVDRGDVEITKHVVAEEQTIDVPVTEEQVEVTRRAVDRDVAPGEHAFEEGTIEMPVHGEEVEVEKRTRVTEEVDVDKTAEQHTERVSDTVRREEVDIDGEPRDRNSDPERRR